MTRYSGIATHSEVQRRPAGSRTGVPSHLLCSHLISVKVPWGSSGILDVVVQTDSSEKIDLRIREAFKGFLTFLSPIRCPLWLTNFFKLFHVSLRLVANIVEGCRLIEGVHLIREKNFCEDNYS